MRQRDGDAILIAGDKSIRHALEREAAWSAIWGGMKVAGITRLLGEAARKAWWRAIGVTMRRRGS